MSRLLIIGSLAAATIAGFAAWPANADRSYRNTLDEKGRPIAASWANTPRFETLTATGMDDVSMIAGDRWRIRASGDPRAVAQLRFLAENNGLIVGRISGVRERFGKARVEITAPSLKSLTAAGSGAVDVDRLTGERASAVVAGSGHATVRRVDADRLNATVAGSGGLNLTGRSDRADVTIAGSGDLTGDQFTAGSANVTVAGSGGARFRSPGDIRATIVGSGTVTVTGTTACRDTKMGSGRLICRR